MTRRCAKRGGDHPIIACPELEAMSREARNADRSDLADEIFEGEWAVHGEPHIAASPTMAPFAELFKDLAREWHRRGYSRGGMDGAGLMGREMMGFASELAAELGGEKDQNSGE